jgi:peptidyl-prolyl cis-trans isomerase SurA
MELIGVLPLAYGDQAVQPPVQKVEVPAKFEGRKLIDGVVAQVDKEPPILHSKIQEKVDVGPVILVSPFPATAEDPAYKRALQDEINLGLVLKRARELEIKVSAEDIDNQVRVLLKQEGAQKLDLRELEAFLQETHKTMESFRKDLETQMLVMRFLGREIMPQVKTTQRDLEAFYLQQPGHRESAVLVQLKQILVPCDPDAPPALREEKKKLADEAYLKLQGGMEFSTAVRLYSDGGLQGADKAKPIEIKLADLPPNLQEALSGVGLKGGSFTEPKLTPQGYRILYVVDSKFASSEDFLRQKDQLEQKLRQSLREKELVAWLQKARNKAKIYLVN